MGDLYGRLHARHEVILQVDAEESGNAAEFEEWGFEAPGFLILRVGDNFSN